LAKAMGNLIAVDEDEEILAASCTTGWFSNGKP
jgi:hypothetical protein